jgi:hypothetical protein
MTVSGPDGYSYDLHSRIKPVGERRRWKGNDRYTATTDDIEGGSDGDTYQCTVTSAGSRTRSVNLIVGSGRPTITSLEQTAPTAVRAEWSPSELSIGTGYVVRYWSHDGVDVGSLAVGVTQADIRNLTNGKSYNVTVAATLNSSDILPGSSMVFIKLGLDPPKHVEVTAKSTSLRVTWQPVDNASSYFVIFTKSQGKGRCPHTSHTLAVSVSVPVTVINITMGQGVDREKDVLRAYTEYSITVRAVNDTRGNSGKSEIISVLTMQRGAGHAPTNVNATARSSTEISSMESQALLTIPWMRVITGWMEEISY